MGRSVVALLEEHFYLKANGNPLEDFKQGRAFVLHSDQTVQ